jgi:hypothetical protein
VASLIQGVPVFVTDPIPERSQVWPVCNTDLTIPKTPKPLLYEKIDFKVLKKINYQN